MQTKRLDTGDQLQAPTFLYLYTQEWHIRHNTTYRKSYSPQGQRGLVGEASGAEDGRPLTGGRVHTAFDSVGRAGVHEIIWKKKRK